MTDIRTKTLFSFLATHFVHPFVRSSFQFFFLSFLFPSLFHIYLLYFQFVMCLFMYLFHMCLLLFSICVVNSCSWLQFDCKNFVYTSTHFRRESGVKGVFRLDSPATSERIRMACVDEFTKQVKKFTFCFYHQESELDAGGV